MAHLWSGEDWKCGQRVLDQTLVRCIEVERPTDKQHTAKEWATGRRRFLYSTLVGAPPNAGARCTKLGCVVDPACWHHRRSTRRILSA